MLLVVTALRIRFEPLINDSNSMSDVLPIPSTVELSLYTTLFLLELILVNILPALNCPPVFSSTEYVYSNVQPEDTETVCILWFPLVTVVVLTVC